MDSVFTTQAECKHIQTGFGKTSQDPFLELILRRSWILRGRSDSARRRISWGKSVQEMPANPTRTPDGGSRLTMASTAINNTWIHESKKVETFEEAYVKGKELGRFVLVVLWTFNVCESLV